MQVSEVFSSVQGEGLQIGIPSLFVRLTGCNKTCEYCDTKGKINKVFWEGGVTKLNSWIQDMLFDDPSGMVVITGGEPLIWKQELIDLVGLIKRDCGISINIQSNGELLEVAEELGGKVFWSFSPKLISAGKENRMEKKQFVKLMDFMREFGGELKFVISEEDFPYVDELLNSVNMLRIKLVFQPVINSDINGNGELNNMLNLKKYGDLYKKIVERYKTTGGKFIPQIHKFVDIL